MPHEICGTGIVGNDIRVGIDKRPFDTELVEDSGIPERGFAEILGKPYHLYAAFQ